MLTLILLFCLACLALPILFWLAMCALEVMPLALGLLLCWWLFHVVGCL